MRKRVIQDACLFILGRASLLRSVVWCYPLTQRPQTADAALQANASEDLWSESIDLPLCTNEPKPFLTSPTTWCCPCAT